MHARRIAEMSPLSLWAIDDGWWRVSQGKRKYSLLFYSLEHKKVQHFKRKNDSNLSALDNFY